MPYEATFTWPYPAASTVIVTGTFDHWSCSFPLRKTNNGFSTTIQVPYGTKVLYKFVVDGQWLTGNDAPTEWDGRGNLNNWFVTPEAPPVVAPKPAQPAVPAEPEVPKAEPPAEIVPEVAPSSGLAGSLTDGVKSAGSAIVNPAVDASKTPEEPITVAESLPTAVAEPQVIHPTHDVPVVEVIKPVEKPSSAEAGTGLGADAAAARVVLESLEAAEEKIVVPKTTGVPAVVEPTPKEEPLKTPELTQVPISAPESVTPTPIPTIKLEPAPVETPVSIPVVEVPATPSTPPPKGPVVVDLSPPTKIVSDTPPVVQPTSSTFSTTSSSSTNSPEKVKSFPLKGSPPASPSKSLKKEETRKKRTSLIKRIKHVFSSKD